MALKERGTAKYLSCIPIPPFFFDPYSNIMSVPVFLEGHLSHLEILELLDIFVLCSGKIRAVDKPLLVFQANIFSQDKYTSRGESR